MDHTARVICRGLVQLGLQRFRAVLQRCLQCAKHGSGPAASVPYQVQIRLETYGLVIIVRRAIVLTLLQVSFGAVSESFSVTWLDVDGFVESPDCKVVFANPYVGHAPVIVGLGKMRCEFDRFIEVMDSAIVIPLANKSTPTIIIQDGQS